MKNIFIVKHQTDQIPSDSSTQVDQKNDLFVKKHRLQLFFVHFYIKPQVAVLRSVHVQQMQRQVIYWVQKIQVLYSGQGGFAQGQTFLGRSGLNNMQSTGSSNKKWRRTSILHQQWNYSILHAFFLTPTTNLVFRPGHMVFSIINHPEEKHNFLGLGQGLGNTVAKLGHHICGSCTQALVPCACCGCCWGGGGRVLPKSGWRVLKQKKEPVYM